MKNIRTVRQFLAMTSEREKALLKSNEFIMRTCLERNIPIPDGLADEFEKHYDRKHETIRFLVEKGVLRP